MGCDIVSWAEVYVPEVERWRAVVNAFPTDPFEREHHHAEFVSEPFRSRKYGLFGFLAGVRNYARCEPLAEPRGLPPGWPSAFNRVSAQRANKNARLEQSLGCTMREAIGRSLHRDCHHFAVSRNVNNSRPVWR